MRRLYRFLAARLRRSSSPVAQVVELAVALDRPRNLEAAASPAARRPPGSGPSIGTITFVASRQLSPVRPCGGIGDVVAEEVVRPDRRP